MHSAVTAILLLVLFCACNTSPTTTTATTKDAEREHPDKYLKVNYEVHRNLLGKKVIEGTVINTGKYLTYKTVTLKIESVRDGDGSSVSYTVPEAVAPGGQATFKFKPEGNPEKIKVSVASASAD